MKKVLSILFSLLLVFGVGTSAFAATANGSSDQAKGLEIADKATSQIQEKIDKALEKANDVREKYLRDLEKSNKDTGKITQKYDDDVKKIMDKLYDETYSISTKAIDQAAKYGVKVERTWTTITFAEKDYLIDPIRVVIF